MSIVKRRKPDIHLSLTRDYEDWRQHWALYKYMWTWYVILMSPCLVFSGEGTTPVFWAVLAVRVDSDFISLYSTTVTSSELLSGHLVQLLSFFLWQWPYAFSYFSAILGSCHFLLINTVLCSELLFGRLEPWLSYLSDVPDLSCKDRSGGYWFICRFLERVQMIILPRSECCTRQNLWSPEEAIWPSSFSQGSRQRKQ